MATVLSATPTVKHGTRFLITRKNTLANKMPKTNVRFLSSSTPSIIIPHKNLMIKGRVQGVCYRDWTVENATQLVLKGWVQNRRDGSVEALFSGNPDAVQEMEQRCRGGPPAAMVTGLQVFPSDEDPGAAFECRLTV